MKPAFRTEKFAGWDGPALEDLMDTSERAARFIVSTGEEHRPMLLPLHDVPPIFGTLTALLVDPKDVVPAIRARLEEERAFGYLITVEAWIAPRATAVQGRVSESPDAFEALIMHGELAGGEQRTRIYRIDRAARDITREGDLRHAERLIGDLCGLLPPQTTH